MPDIPFLAQPSASRLARPQNLHSKAMSLIHELSQTTAKARRDATEKKRLYDLETERLVQALVATEKQRFIRECRMEAQNERNSCSMSVTLSNKVQNRDGGKDVTEQKLWAMLVELGFHNGKVYWRNLFGDFTVSATWPVADAASPEEPSQKRARGTSMTCPICHEHRPAVVLMPCGHVVCRDCQRCQQFRQCPMCRRPISSASDGLFMD